MVNATGRRVDTHLSQVRVQLIAMAQALEDRLDTRDAHISAERDEVEDEVDRAQRVSEGRFAETLELALVESRDQIVHALDVLDAGGYGVCEDCGTRISQARLAFCAESTRCLPCQSKEDRDIVGDGRLM
jgi:DnaK suppressor protein